MRQRTLFEKELIHSNVLARGPEALHGGAGGEGGEEGRGAGQTRKGNYIHCKKECYQQFYIVTIF